MSKNHSLAQNIIAKGALNIFNALLPLILTTYVYRVLGPINIGNIEYATSIIGYFMMFGLLGTYNYGLREISANRNNPVLVRNIFKNLLCINLFSNIIAISAYIVFVYFWVHDPLLRAISWILCGNLISQVFYIEWYNEAMEEFRFITIKTVAIRLLSLFFIFVFVKKLEDVYIYVAITSGVTIINYLVSYIYARRESGIPLRELFTDLNPKPYIIPLLTIMVLNNTVVLYTMADRTILGYFTGPENVAYMALGGKIVEVTRTLLLSIVFATLPRLSLYLREDKELYQAGVLKIMRLVLFLTIPAGIGLFLLSPNVVYIFGGADFSGAVPVMRLFSIRMIMLGIEAIIYNQIIFLHGKELKLLIYNLICGSLNVALNFACIPILTPLVSLGCTFASEIIFETLCIRFIINKLKVRLGILKPYTLIYFLATLSFVPIYWGIHQLNLSLQWECLYVICACIIAYLSIMALCRDKAFLMMKEYAVSFIKRSKNQ